MDKSGFDSNGNSKIMAKAFNPFYESTNFFQERFTSFSAITSSSVPYNPITCRVSPQPTVKRALPPTLTKYVDLSSTFHSNYSQDYKQFCSLPHAFNRKKTEGIRGQSIELPVIRVMKRFDVGSRPKKA